MQQPFDFLNFLVGLLDQFHAFRRAQLQLFHGRQGPNRWNGTDQVCAHQAVALRNHDQITQVGIAPWISEPVFTFLGHLDDLFAEISLVHQHAGNLSAHTVDGLINLLLINILITIHLQIFNDHNDTQIMSQPGKHGLFGVNQPG